MQKKYVYIIFILLLGFIIFYVLQRPLIEKYLWGIIGLSLIIGFFWIKFLNYIKEKEPAGFNKLSFYFVLIAVVFSIFRACSEFSK